MKSYEYIYNEELHTLRIYHSQMGVCIKKYTNKY